MSARGNSLGLGVVAAGAAALIVSTFLPMFEPTGLFRFVQQNSLIQHDGWILMAAAIAIAGTGYRAFRTPSDWKEPFTISVLTALGIVYWAVSKDIRTLYPVNQDGTVDSTADGVVAAHGVAIYVAGLGVALALIGSIMLRQGSTNPNGVPGQPESPRATKKCPDCAEIVLLDARVCKHCGFRFLETAAPPPPVALWAVKTRGKIVVECPHCDAEQRVPKDATRYTCGRCKQISPVPD